MRGYDQGAETLIVILACVVAMLATVVSLRVKTFPTCLLLGRENVEKILDNTLLVGTLMLAFSLSSSSAVSTNELMEFDAKYLARPCLYYYPFDDDNLPSFTFASRILSGSIYLIVAVLYTWVLSTSLNLLGSTSDENISRTVLPSMVYLMFMMSMGMVRYYWVFLVHLNLILPLNIDREDFYAHRAFAPASAGLGGVLPVALLLCCRMRPRAFSLPPAHAVDVNDKAPQERQATTGAPPPKGTSQTHPPTRTPPVQQPTADCPTAPPPPLESGSSSETNRLLQQLVKLQLESLDHQRRTLATLQQLTNVDAGMHFTGAEPRVAEPADVTVRLGCDATADDTTLLR